MLGTSGMEPTEWWKDVGCTKSLYNIAGRRGSEGTKTASQEAEEPAGMPGKFSGYLQLNFQPISKPLTIWDPSCIYFGLSRMV